MPMTPIQVREAVRQIKAMTGHENTHVSLYIASWNHAGSEKPVSISMYPRGLANDRHPLSYASDTWEDLFIGITNIWKAYEATEQADAIRRMALLIIEYTDLNGSCTSADLRLKGFSDKDIETFGARAIEKASEMADRKPFDIVVTPRSNGDPQDEE